MQTLATCLAPGFDLQQGGRTRPVISGVSLTKRRNTSADLAVRLGKFPQDFGFQVDWGMMPPLSLRSLVGAMHKACKKDRRREPVKIVFNNCFQPSWRTGDVAK